MKISILTPTRNRPNNCERFIKSIYSTCSERKNIELLFYIDNDDPALETYRSLHTHCQEEYKDFATVKFVVGEPISVSKSWNEIAELSTGDVMIMGNDDLIYRTDGWDNILEKELEKFRNGEFEDDIFVAWFDDKINWDRHCAFPIVSRTWYDLLGKFTPGVFNFGYNDTWIFEVGKMLGRLHFIPSVVVEHLHFSKGAPMDDTYARNRTQEKGNLYARDKVLFEKTRQGRQKDRDVLHKHMQITSMTKLEAKEINPDLEFSHRLMVVSELKKEWAATSHKLKEDPLPEQTEQYKKLCKSIDKNGMTHPIIVDENLRVLRGNQRVWYCIDNGILAISAYHIKDSDIDRYIQATYIYKDDYPL